MGGRETEPLSADPQSSPATASPEAPEETPPSWSRRARSLVRRAAIDTRPLGQPAFRRLWIGQAVSFTGFQLTSVAISVQVYDLTKSSLWVGLLGPANLVPLIVFGLWGGAVADMMDRRRLLIMASL